MKAFEEFIGPDKCPIELKACIIGEDSCKSCTEALKVGWKAALKWVLNNNEIVTDQLDFIEEELES